MSLLTCQHCDRFIDTDDDPQCFIEAPCEIILCEQCREDIAEYDDDEQRWRYERKG